MEAQIYKKQMYRVVNADKLADTARDWFRNIKDRENDYKQYLLKKKEYYQNNKEKIKEKYKQQRYLKLISKWL